MASYDFDLIVIGAGSGGVRAARWAARYGAKVAIAEDDRLGGTCVNRGCIPKKLYAYAAHFHEDFEDAVGFGWARAAPDFDWAKLVANKEAEITRLNGIYGRLLEQAGVTRVASRAAIAGPHEVVADGRTMSARYVLVATGGVPQRPDIPGAELGIVSDDAFDLKALPRRIAIVGGGYIAVEFAGIFGGLGVETTLFYRGEMILRGFDDDVRRHLAAEMAKKGIALRLETNLAKLERRGGALAATTTRGDVVEVDQVLFATGRIPHTAGLGLERAGVELTKSGAIAVDAYSRTNVGSIYAIGDVTDRINLTPVAIHEGMCFAETLFNDRPMRPDYRDVATAVFSHPPVATVGLTEAEARAEFGRVDIYRSTFKPLKHTLSGRDERTLMKLVVDGISDRVLGCHMVGPDSAEIIQGLAIAVKGGATKALFDSTIGIHPTAAEEFVTMREKVPDGLSQAAQ
ncbi:MAG: glutathione-disulfide reductase [Alphaproteobacteria bacterium]